MPRFYGRLIGLKLPQAAYTKRFEAEAQKLVRQAARAWLRAVILQVPVWTGMAKGSIKFARGRQGSLASYLNVAVPIVPHPRAKPTADKNAVAGGAYGQYAFVVSRHTYRFRFRSDVPHFIHNEFFERTDRGAGRQQIQAPWNSLEVGAAAFAQTMREGIPKLPRVKDAIVRTIIPFGI